MFSDLKPVLFRALSISLGLDPEAPATSDLIRPAWSNTPQPSINTDVVYFDLKADSSSFDGYLSFSAHPLPADSPDSPPKDPLRSSSVVQTLRTVPLILHLFFYGPNAETNAFRVRTRLYFNNTPDSPRHLLRMANLIPIPNPPEPETLHEPEGSLWRTRCDLFIRLRYLTTESQPSQEITTPPKLTTISQ